MFASAQMASSRTSGFLQGQALTGDRRAAIPVLPARRATLRVNAIVPEHERCHPLLPARSKPVNQKYLSRHEINQRIVQQWQSTTTKDSHKVTALSKLAFLPRWVKYEVIPAPVRYVWYCITIWSRLLLYAALKQWLRAGASLDAKLSKTGTFSRKVFLERFHRKRPPLDIQYRMSLMQA